MLPFLTFMEKLLRAIEGLLIIERQCGTMMMAKDLYSAAPLFPFVPLLGLSEKGLNALAHTYEKEREKKHIHSVGGYAHTWLQQSSEHKCTHHTCNHHSDN